MQLCALGKWDVDKAVSEVGYMSLMCGQIEKQEWSMAILDRLSRAERRMLYQLNVMDLDGFGLNFLQGQGRAFGLDLTRKFVAHYRDAVSIVVMVNSPFLFRMAWGIASPLLTERQKAKLRVLGRSDDPRTHAALRATIPEEVLPEYLGGRKPVASSSSREANVAAAEEGPSCLPCWPGWCCVGRAQEPASQLSEKRGTHVPKIAPSAATSNEPPTAPSSKTKRQQVVMLLLGLLLAWFYRSWSRGSLVNLNGSEKFTLEDIIFQGSANMSALWKTYFSDLLISVHRSSCLFMPRSG